jgi:hypothetical protein
MARPEQSPAQEVAAQLWSYRNRLRNTSIRRAVTGSSPRTRLNQVSREHHSRIVVTDEMAQCTKAPARSACTPARRSTDAATLRSDK